MEVVIMVRLPFAPATLRVRYLGLNNTRPWNTVHHVRFSSAAPSTADLNQVAQTWASNWVTNFAPMMNTAVRLTSVEVTDISSATGAQGVNVASHDGTRAGTAMSVQVAAVVSWHVNYRWRGGHPRTYYPAGVIADVVNGNTWATAFQSAMGTAAANQLAQYNATPLAGGVCTMVAVRYFDQNALLPTPLVLPVANAAFHTRVDTMRRRLGRELA
jgi:hypothetical protein